MTRVVGLLVPPKTTDFASIPAPATEIDGLMDAPTRADMPFSAIGPLRMDKAARWLAANEHAASYALTQHLIDPRHRSTDFAVAVAVRAGVKRHGGFRAAMASANLKVPVRWRAGRGLMFESGLDAGLPRGCEPNRAEGCRHTAPSKPPMVGIDCDALRGLRLADQTAG